jgi:hypothetical protein
MNIDNYITTISNLNMLIESITDQDIKDVQNSIDVTREKLNALDVRIKNRLNISTIPFRKARIEFFDTINTSVRESTKKYEVELSGRDDFDVVGFDENERFIVIRKNDWYNRIGLLIKFTTIDTRRTQKGELQLFYNENGDLSGYDKTRSGIKEDFKFQFITLY